MFTPASQHAGTQPTPVHPASPSPSPTPRFCAKIAPGFSCVIRDRIHDVQRYLRHTPGSIGIVLHDRATGATWHNANANANDEYPAASTMKLAVMTDLLLRNQRGATDPVHLTRKDWADMYQALYTSDDPDANALWDEFEDTSFLQRIQGFGMTSAEFTPPPGMAPNWGYMYCTPEDLDHLMNYILHKAPASVRDYLVNRLQHVSATDQQWGVWGAGPENHPGNKDGWEQDGTSPHFGPWITNTIGFASSRQQYTWPSCTASGPTTNAGIPASGTAPTNAPRSPPPSSKATTPSSLPAPKPPASPEPPA
ncbi:MAG: hypothetical protein ACR2MP_01535 [Streptosporangiaceae bacterium]